MKRNIKLEIIVFFTIIISFSSCIFNTNLNLISNNINNTSYEIKNVKTQGYWNLTGTPIFIEDDNPSRDWVYHALNYDWCSGSGTLGDPYIIENVYIDGLGSQICISIWDSKTPYFIIRNCTLLNADIAIEFLNTNNGMIINNTCTNSLTGIDLFYYSDNNIILNNTCYNNEFGISLYEYCTLNTIINNKLVQNSFNGLYLQWGTNYNEIISNQIINNGGDYNYLYCGLWIKNCGHNSVLNNTLTHNAQNGITISDNAYDNIFSGNNISDNRRNGMYFIYDAYGNEIVDNLIMKNKNNGIYIAAFPYDPWDNTFYLNKFIENNVNARDDDDNFGNFWDNGTIGNYWDDYTGVDADDDGIGDTPYAIGGSSGGNMDFLPIWYSPPNITINSPNMFDVFGAVAPSYNVYISDPNLNTMWYTINNGIQKVNFTVNGTIDQDLWDATPEGEVVITFYANDTRPNLSFESVKVIKDLGDSPTISINLPISGTLYGDTPPAFNVEISDPNLNTSWYSLDGGTTITIFSSNESIDQSIWDITSDGPVVITFYANDSAGNENSDSVLVQKDTTAPIIQINSPTPNQLCGIDAPTFSLTIVEPNIQIKCYSLNGRPNITFTTQTHFSQPEWDNIGDGTVLITFYVIDKVGNVNSSEVIVRKDAYIPDIIIHSPLQDDVFRNTPPEFNISVVEEDLVSTWYTIENIAGTFPFSELTGSFDQDAWKDVPEGEITITFYALDRAGNLGTESVTVMKSIPSPPAIPGYNIFFLLGIISVVSLIILKKRK